MGSNEPAIIITFRHGKRQRRAAAGIETNNTIQGYDDPTQPFTATTGRDGYGSFRRTLAPLPARIDESVGRAAMLPVDFARAVASGDWGHLKGDFMSAKGILANRLAPLTSGIVNALYSGAGDVFRGKPPTVPSLVGGAATALGPMRGIAQMMRDPAGGALTALGPLTYSVPGRGVTSKELRECIGDVDQLRAMGRGDEADAMLAALRKAQGAKP